MPKMPKLTEPQVVALSRYRPEDYAKFRALPPPDNGMEDTYEEWKRITDVTMPTVLASGHKIEFVDMVFEEYYTWLKSSDREHSPETRALYVHEVVSARYMAKN